MTDHLNFANTEAYNTLGAFLAKVVSFDHAVMSTTAPQMVCLVYLVNHTAHTNFTSDANVPRQAPVTAFKSFMLPEDASQEQKAALENAFLKLAQFNMAQTACIGYACGWSEFVFFQCRRKWELMFAQPCKHFRMMRLPQRELSSSMS